LSKPKAASDLSVIFGAVFIIFGIISLDFAILYSLQILALIGLGLTFWGVVFFLIAPKSYLDALLLTSALYPEYLTSMVSPEYATFDRITNDLECEKGFYIPTISSVTAIPEYLKGLKDPVVFVSSGTDFHLPPVGEILQSKFLLGDDKGVLFTPPGLGLLKQIEKRMKMQPTNLSINQICEILPVLILDDFALAKDILMSSETDGVHLTIQNSIYRSLFSSKTGSKSAQILGCPIASAIACVLAQASGKVVSVARTTVSSDLSTIEIVFRFVS